jgi:hypothetical protein
LWATLSTAALAFIALLLNGLDRRLPERPSDCLPHEASCSPLSGSGRKEQTLEAGWFRPGPALRNVTSGHIGSLRIMPCASASAPVAGRRLLKHFSLHRVTVSGDSRASRHSKGLRSVGSASCCGRYCSLHRTGPCDVKTRPPADRAPGSGNRRTQQPQPAGCAEEGRG